MQFCVFINVLHEPFNNADILNEFQFPKRILYRAFKTHFGA